MVSSWTENILTTYDQCKRLRSAEECRQLASVGASRSVKGYLTGYDTCIDIMGVERCRSMLSSDRSAVIMTAGVFFVAGFVVGRIMK